MFLKGEVLNNFPSYQGFIGAINTPNSETLNEGEFEFLYTNQVDNFSPLSSTNFRNNKEQDSYLLNMGLLPNLDVSLRKDIFRKFEYLSDRIVNSKYQIPFIPFIKIYANLVKVSKKLVIASQSL